MAQATIAAKPTSIEPDSNGGFKPDNREGMLKPVKFAGSDAFVREVRKRVDNYFKTTGKKPRDCPRMYAKSISILVGFFAFYAVMLFFVRTWYFAIPGSILLGFGVAAVGFNIQHDGGHKAYSERKWLNKLTAMTMDLMGASSYLWDWKHNTIHHTYPNITGHDDDIDLGFLGRVSPHQPRYWFHRFQAYYLWLLYGFLAIKWNFVDDFMNVAKGRLGGHKVPRPKGMDLFIFIAGKVVFFSMAIGVPMLFHPWWAVLGCYAVAAFTSGVVLSVVFQLAHCVEEADFPMPDESGKMETDWAVHQVQTTVDFCRRSKFACWFMGGLNFQVEHHLFRKICHVHYPAISKVVEETCREFGVRYSENRTFAKAVASHFHLLNRMGKAT